MSSVRQSRSFGAGDKSRNGDKSRRASRGTGNGSRRQSSGVNSSVGGAEASGTMLRARGGAPLRAGDGLHVPQKTAIVW